LKIFQVFTPVSSATAFSVDLVHCNSNYRTTFIEMDFIYMFRHKPCIGFY